jgi:hypothetical protein
LAIHAPEGRPSYSDCASAPIRGMSSRLSHKHKIRARGRAIAVFDASTEETGEAPSASAIRSALDLFEAQHRRILKIRFEILAARHQHPAEARVCGREGDHRLHTSAVRVSRARSSAHRCFPVTLSKPPLHCATGRWCHSRSTIPQYLFEASRTRKSIRPGRAELAYRLWGNEIRRHRSGRAARTLEGGLSNHERYPDRRSRSSKAPRSGHAGSPQA